MRDRAYRRDVKQKSHNHRLKIITSCGFKTPIGYLDGEYIKFPKNSNKQRYHKKCSNKKIRQVNIHLKGNEYRKHYEYQYRVY